MHELDIRRILAPVCRGLGLRAAARRSAWAALGASRVVSMNVGIQPLCVAVQAG